MVTQEDQQAGDHSAALAHYDRALDLARLDSDSEAEGMVLLGKGFALMSIGRAQEASTALEACMKLSGSNPAQQRFVGDLLSQVHAAASQQQGQHNQDPSSSAASPYAEYTEAVSGQEAGGVHGEDAYHQAVRTAFVRSVVLKETVVLVMEGSPPAAATALQHSVVNALQQVRLRFHYIDVTHDKDLAAEFVQVWRAQAEAAEEGEEDANAASSTQSEGKEVKKEEAAKEAGRGEEGVMEGDLLPHVFYHKSLPADLLQQIVPQVLPLLFIGGKLFGGAHRVMDLGQKGVEHLKSKLRDALPSHLTPQELADFFSAPEIEAREWSPPQQACGGNDEHANDSSKACILNFAVCMLLSLYAC